MNNMKRKALFIIVGGVLGIKIMLMKGRVQNEKSC